MTCEGRCLGTGASGDVSSLPREASGRIDTILPVDLIASDVKLRTLPPIWKVKLTHGEEQSQVNHRTWMTRFLNFYLKLTHFRVICGSFSWSSQLPATEGILTDTAILLKGTGKRTQCHNNGDITSEVSSAILVEMGMHYKID